MSDGPPTEERFCVIGSNSFSGASFVAGALREGASVLGISRSSEADPVYLPYRWGECGRYRFAEYDLNRQSEAMLAAIQDFSPQYVVNFAAQGMVAQSWQKPEDWYQTNVVAMAKLHEGLRKIPSLKKFVHASTPEVYGNTSGIIQEDAPYRPSTPYAISKAACDLNLMAYYSAYGFPVVLTRAANVCGAGQAMYRIIPRTVLCGLTASKLRLEGGGSSVRAFIHIDDVVDATLMAARHGPPGSIFHLSTERFQTIREVVEQVCQQLEVSFSEVVEIAPARLAQDAAYLLDSQAARKQLGWSPKRTTEQAISDVVVWMRQNLATLQALPTDYIHKP